MADLFWFPSKLHLREKFDILQNALICILAREKEINIILTSALNIRLQLI